VVSLIRPMSQNMQFFFDGFPYAYKYKFIEYYLLIKLSEKKGTFPFHFWFVIFPHGPCKNKKTKVFSWRTHKDHIRRCLFEGRQISIWPL